MSATPTPEAQRGDSSSYALSFPPGASAASAVDRRLDPSRFKGSRGYTPHPYPGRFHSYTSIGLDAVSPRLGASRSVVSLPAGLLRR